MILTSTLSLALVSLLSCSTLLVAQVPPVPPDRNRPTSGRDRGGASHVRFEPPPVPDRDAPGQRQGGASRSSGQCPPRAVDKPLTALVPVIQRPSAPGRSSRPAMIASQSVIGLTTVEYPTLWFYVPYSLSSTASVEFILQDEDGNEIYQTFLTPSGRLPGVVGFQLPSTAEALEVNKRYHWYLLIYCGRTQYVFVDGWVQRTALDSSLQNQLAQATPQEKVALYAGAGIWHEALTNLAELRRNKPKDAALTDDWTQLLQSVGLEAIAPEPITSALEPQ